MQPTTAMPVQPPPPAQAYGQQYPPAQAYAQQPYRQPGYPQQPYAAPYPQQARAATVKGGSILLGIMAMVSGLLIAGSAFINWLPGSSMFDMSGFRIMTGSDVTNFVYTSLPGGGIFFSGFTTLLVGGIVFIAGIVMLFRRRLGGIFVLIFGLIGTSVAAVNVVMVFTKLNQFEGLSTMPQAGLWLFLGMSIVALVLGIIGVARSG